MKTTSAKLRKRPQAISRHDVVRLRLVRMNATEIAVELKSKPDTISGILQEPEVIAAIDEAEKGALEDAQKGLRSLARKAMQRLAKLIDDPDPKIALDAVKAALTKAGADAPTKSELTGKDGAPVQFELTPSEAAAELEHRLAALSPEERELAERLLKR
jgi:hypothetical protein